MKILFDTNVLLDVLLARQPWATEGRKLWQANDSGQIQGYVSATTLTDIFYVTRRMTDNAIALEAVKSCLRAFEIIHADRGELEQATLLPGNDFEDNLQITCAHIGGLDGIVTRDPKGFQFAKIPIWTPAQALAHFSTS